MTQTEISEYNRRCAEFLGITTGYFKDEIDCANLEYQWMCVSANCTYEMQKEDYPLLDVWDYLKFDRDWNWVMKVVEAIEDIIFDEDNSFNVTIGSTNYCVIQDSNGEVYETIQDYGNSKLETVIKAINQFLIWYNEQVNETGSVNKKM